MRRLRAHDPARGARHRLRDARRRRARRLRALSRARRGRWLGPCRSRRRWRSRGPSPAPPRPRASRPDPGLRAAGASGGCRGAGDGAGAAARADPDPPPTPTPKPEPEIADTSERRIRRAIERFNESDEVRVVAGLMRSLGEPTRLSRTSRPSPPGRGVTVAWELSWYRWEVAPDSGADAVREVAKGDEISELEGGEPGGTRPSTARAGCGDHTARSQRRRRLARQSGPGGGRGRRRRPPTVRSSRSAARRSARRPTTSPSTAPCCSGIELARALGRRGGRAGRRLRADRAPGPRRVQVKQQHLRPLHASALKG